jgi:hypothetical protein
MATTGRELLAYERNQPVLVDPAPNGGPPPRPRRGRRVAGALAGALVLVCAGIAVGAFARDRSVDQQTRRAVRAEEQVSALRNQAARQARTISDQQRTLQQANARLARPRPTPTQPSVAVNAATSFGDGLYQVGLAIQPGRYTTPGAADCYWAKLSTGDTNKVIVNNQGVGPQTVTIDSPYFESEACGSWTKVG